MEYILSPLKTKEDLFFVLFLTFAKLLQGGSYYGREISSLSGLLHTASFCCKRTVFPEPSRREREQAGHTGQWWVLPFLAGPPLRGGSELLSVVGAVYTEDPRLNLWHFQKVMGKDYCLIV